jgi:hypothetical protein
MLSLFQKRFVFEKHLLTPAIELGYGKGPFQVPVRGTFKMIEETPTLVRKRKKEIIGVYLKEEKNVTDPPISKSERSHGFWRLVTCIRTSPAKSLMPQTHFGEIKTGYNLIVRG